MRKLENTTGTKIDTQIDRFFVEFTSGRVKGQEMNWGDRLLRSFSFFCFGSCFVRGGAKSVLRLLGVDCEVQSKRSRKEENAGVVVLEAGGKGRRW